MEQCNGFCFLTGKKPKKSVFIYDAQRMKEDEERNFDDNRLLYHYRCSNVMVLGCAHS